MNKRDVPADEGHEAESNTGRAASISGRLAYWWALIAAGLLLIFLGVPAILVEWATRRFKVVYPVAVTGARSGCV